MSKARIKAANFLSRSADKTMNGFGNGFLDIVPPGAVDIKKECNGVIEQLEIIALEVSRWELIKKHRRLTKEESHRYQAIKGVYGNLKKTIKEASPDRRGWVFMRVAHHLLDGDDLRRINIEVEKILLREMKDQPA